MGGITFSGRRREWDEKHSPVQTSTWRGLPGLPSNACKSNSALMCFSQHGAFSPRLWFMPILQPSALSNQRCIMQRQLQAGKSPEPPLSPGPCSQGREAILPDKEPPCLGMVMQIAPLVPSVRATQPTRLSSEDDLSPLHNPVAHTPAQVSGCPVHLYSQVP